MELADGTIVAGANAVDNGNPAIALAWFNADGSLRDSGQPSGVYWFSQGVGIDIYLTHLLVDRYGRVLGYGHLGNGSDSDFLIQRWWP